MRITSTSLYLTVQDGLARSLGTVQQYEAQLSSGRRINSYADDPVGSASALRMRSSESAWSTAYQPAAQDAKSWLGVTDGALQSMSSLMQRVRDLALSSQNGALSDAARGAMADEIDQLRTQMQDLANTQYLGRPIFGGFGKSAVSHDAATDSYSFAGDNGQVLRQVSPDVTLQVNLDGAKLLGFSGGGPDVFASLKSLSANIRAGGATPADVQDLDTAFGRVTASLGVVGAMTNRVQAASDLGSSNVTELQTERSKVEDADIAQTILKLNQAQVGYQAALGAAAKANLPSLADYLG